MIAIIDGGSTKCDWLITNSKGVIVDQAYTIGFNPNLIKPHLISEEISLNSTIFSYKNSIEKVYFYGSGCGLEKNKIIVANELQKVFPNAYVSVKDDLTAAAYSGYQGTPAIICILGTGSNSCFFDGKTIRKDVPSLGYLLGDQGSGTAFGKLLLQKYFMRKLPIELHELFYKKYELTVEEIIQNIYNSPRANAYIASFNTFVLENKEHPYFQEIIDQEMKSFFEYMVLPYPEAKSVEINFIGSIAFYYQENLHKVAKELQLNLGQIVKKPIENLLKYHIRYLF